MTEMMVLSPLSPAQIPAVALPMEACMYCWYVLHPHAPYPEAWSSTCCAEHRTWIDRKRAARRLCRLLEQNTRRDGANLVGT